MIYPAGKAVAVMIQPTCKHSLGGSEADKAKTVTTTHYDVESPTLYISIILSCLSFSCPIMPLQNSLSAVNTFTNAVYSFEN